MPGCVTPLDAAVEQVLVRAREHVAGGVGPRRAVDLAARELLARLDDPSVTDRVVG